MSKALLTRIGIPPRLQQELKGLSTATLLTLFSLPSPTINWLLTMSNVAVDKIGPFDRRISHEYVEVNGHRWHYVDAKPQGPQKGTIFLVHGFPDIWLAWRYQVPLLSGMGFRCIIPDCMGYGGSDAPRAPPASLHLYGWKHHADSLAGIAKHIGVNKIILGGHDWGGMVVYRFAQWYPDLVTHVFSVATPFFAPNSTYVSTEELVGGPLPNFGYQLQFGSNDETLEKNFNSKPTLRKFLKAAYGGQVPSRANLFSPETGFNVKAILSEEVSASPLLSAECQEVDYYVDHFAINGMHGPCNWYRTTKVNHDEDSKIPEATRSTVPQPTLFVACEKDDVLIPAMSAGMEKHIPNLSRASVPASHWALWHTPQETNDAIKKWFDGVVFGGKSKL